jgi:hypothetical protein
LPSRLWNLAPNHPSAVTEVSALELSGGNSAAAGDAFRPGDEAPGPDRPERPGPPLWLHVPRLKALWADHVKRWQDDRGKQADGASRRPACDPPGSWRGSGDQYLNPDAKARADDVIKSLQLCEPRVTETLKAIEKDAEYGGLLVGLDHRLKDADRLREKIADKMAVKPGTGPADVAAGIVDAVRYTFCFGDDSYVRGCRDVQRRLTAKGYELVYQRNHWVADVQYKGINCRWKTPDGHMFELQFHTAESFFAKESLTHPAYRRGRRPTTSRAELAALTAFQRDVCEVVTMPAEISDVPDHNVRQ